MDLAAASAIFARYAHQFVAVYVFGSVAAGTADEHSDIDVIVVRHTTKPFFDRMREIMDLRLEFGAADMLIYTPAVGGARPVLRSDPVSARSAGRDSL